MNQKEFKKQILPELEKAWQAAKSFSADGLIAIEGLRGAIKYQLQQLAYEPSYKSADELKEYKKEIRARIAESKIKINSIYRQYGWITIQFPNGNGYYRLVNARQEIERVISKVRGLTDNAHKPARKFQTREENPRAHKEEVFDGIYPINRDDWYTDGRILIKGKAPEGMEFRNDIQECHKKNPANITGILGTLGKVARKLYYYLDSNAAGLTYISANPVPTYKKNNDVIEPRMVFECDGKYWIYSQNRFNYISNRYSAIDRFEITDDGQLNCFIDKEIVAVLMPICGDEEDRRYQLKAPLEREAIRAVLIKPKVVLPYSGRKFENQMRLGL